MQEFSALDRQSFTKGRSLRFGVVYFYVGVFCAVLSCAVESLLLVGRTKEIKV